MKNLIKISCIIFFMCSALSCADFLDQVPEEKLNEGNMYEKRADAIKVLTYAYSYYKPVNNPQHYMGAVADESDFLWVTYDPYAKDVGKYGPNNLIYNFWYKYYEMIKVCMTFYERIDECTDASPDEINWWKGESLFLQAYYYYLLWAQYGPVTLVDKLHTMEEFENILGQGMARNHSNDIVNHIDYLLEESCKYLDLNYTSSSPERAGRANQAAAKFLRARLWVYAASPLYNGMQKPSTEPNAGKDYSNMMPKDKSGNKLMNDTFNKDLWAKALQACEEAIDVCHAAGLKLYTGEANGYLSYRKVMTYTRSGDPCPEFVLYKQNENNTQLRNQSLPLSWGKFSGYSVITEMIDSYFMANGLLPEDDQTYQQLRQLTEPSFFTYSQVGKTMRHLTKHTKRDPRFYGSVLFPGQYSYAMIDSVQESISTRWAYSTNTSFNDYIWFRPFNDGPDGFSSRTGQNYTITGSQVIKYVGITDNKTSQPGYANFTFRLGELYLNHAEARLEYCINNGIDPANDAALFTYWDQIRARVGLPGVRSAYTKARIPLTEAKLRQLIHREREIELAFEGHRYFDNRRWMIAEREGGDKHGFNVFRNEIDPEFWNDKTTFETRYWHDKMYFMPIPQSEIERNPLMSQNPMWEE